MFAYAFCSYISVSCTFPLISDTTQKDFTHCVPLENTQAPQDFPIPVRAMLFIFQRYAALTLPFVYGHKYSFKPPSWYLDEAIRLSSLIRDHQSSPDRSEIVVVTDASRKCFATYHTFPLTKNKIFFFKDFLNLDAIICLREANSLCLINI